MSHLIMVGIDVHDKNLVCAWSTVHDDTVRRAVYRNDFMEIARMIDDFFEAGGGRGQAQVHVAYEASGHGFNLHDRLGAAGVSCSVLAPSRIDRSVKHRSCKNDRVDAKKLMEILRGHLLAGTELPAIWAPGLKQRDDRELVRARLTFARDLTRTKTRIRSLLKFHGLQPPDGVTLWSAPYHRWLERLAAGGAELADGAAEALTSHLQIMTTLMDEVDRLGAAVSRLARSDTHRRLVEALTTIMGVGELTAMVFLAELGDLRRFPNRRKLAAFLGLAPSQHGSGETDGRTGRITRQGSARIRGLLCQAVWVVLGRDRAVSRRHARIMRGDPARKKKATVAMMRKLALRMRAIVLEVLGAMPGPYDALPA